MPLIVPLFSLQFGQEDVGVTPTDTTERQAYDLMTEGFGVGYNGPLLIASTLDPGHTQRRVHEEVRPRHRAQEAAEAEQRQLQARPTP